MFLRSETQKEVTYKSGYNLLLITNPIFYIFQNRTGMISCFKRNHKCKTM